MRFYLVVFALFVCYTGRQHATNILVVVSYKHLKPGGAKSEENHYTIDTCPGLLAHFSKPVELVGSYGSDLRQACSAGLTLPAPTEAGKLLHSPAILIHAHVQTTSTNRDQYRCSALPPTTRPNCSSRQPSRWRR